MVAVNDPFLDVDYMVSALHCVCVCMFTFGCACIRAYMRIDPHMYVCMYSVCACMCIHVCVYICLHAWCIILPTCVHGITVIDDHCKLVHSLPHVMYLYMCAPTHFPLYSVLLQHTIVVVRSEVRLDSKWGRSSMPAVLMSMQYVWYGMYMWVSLAVHVQCVWLPQ